MAVIDYIQSTTLPVTPKKMGQRFRAGFDSLLKKYPSLLLEVRQKGLMMGLHIPMNPSVPG